MRTVMMNSTISLCRWAALVATFMLSASACTLVTHDEPVQCKNDSDCASVASGQMCDVSIGICTARSSVVPTSGGSTGGPPVVIPPEAIDAPAGADAGSSPPAAPVAEPCAGAGAPDAGVCVPTPVDECPLSVDCPPPPSEQSLAWSLAELRPGLGDSSGGSYFAEYCAADEVVIGAALGFGGWLDQVVGICARVHLTDEPPNFATLERSSELLPHPLESASERQEIVCPAGLSVVGLRISQQNYMAELESGPVTHVVVPRVWLECAELYRNDSTDTTLHVKEAIEVGPASGTYADQAAWFASDAIAADQIVVGLHGYSGSWIDRLGLTTAAPVIVTAP
jgi:hypothetical protein